MGSDYGYDLIVRTFSTSLMPPPSPPNFRRRADDTIRQQRRQFPQELGGLSEQCSRDTPSPRTAIGLPPFLFTFAPVQLAYQSSLLPTQAGILTCATWALLCCSHTPPSSPPPQRRNRHKRRTSIGMATRCPTVPWHALEPCHFNRPGMLLPGTLSPDGLTLATATSAPKGEGVQLGFMDTATGKTLRLRKFHLADSARRFDNSQMRLTTDGKSLIFSGGSGITRYDIATGKSLWSIAGQDNGAFAISSDGKRVAFQPRVYVKDAPVRLWQTLTKKEVAVLPGRGAVCKGLTFSVDGKRLLLWSIVPTSVSENGMSWGNQSKAALACIDIGAGKIVGETTAGGGQEVALCSDGETIALEAADQRSVRVLHLPSGAERCTIPVKRAKLAFAPSGKILLTIDRAGQAALWDVTKGSKIRDLEGHLANSDFRLVGFSANGKTIAVLDGGWQSAATVVVWHADTGQRVKRPPGHQSAITCLAYAPDGKRLASGSLDKTVRLWNPATGEHLRTVGRARGSDHGGRVFARWPTAGVVERGRGDAVDQSCRWESRP